MGHELTKKQIELWKLADTELKKIGGIGYITRNPDRAVREAAKKEGTRQWALLQSCRLANPQSDEKFTDAFCDKLINCIK